MTASQVEFFVVPRSAIGAKTTPLTAATLAATAWWASARVPADYRERLAEVAPAEATTTPGLESWSTHDGNRIDVTSADGRVTEIRVRVDVRRLDPKFGAALLGFVKRAQAVLVRRDGHVAEPTVSAFSGTLRSSAAWRFVSEPPAVIADPVPDDPSS
ncbi:MAG: hypothetical protein M3081_21910 [Gemmatimonadota bacterium]|nr:hypothetical protein [Gemmatimonadota bacterium]